MARPRTICDAALLRAARAVFTTHGAEASTRAVADAAGISQSVLFQRFGTKKALFFAAMLPGQMAVDAILGDLPEPGAGAARRYLVEVAHRLADAIHAALPGTLRAALHPAYPGALDKAHRTTTAEPIVAALAERLRQLQARGDLNPGIDPAQAAATLAEQLHGQALAALLGAAPRAPAAIDRAAAILWQGLAPDKAREAGPGAAQPAGVAPKRCR